MFSIINNKWTNIIIVLRFEAGTLAVGEAIYRFRVCDNVIFLLDEIGNILMNPWFAYQLSSIFSVVNIDVC